MKTIMHLIFQFDTGSLEKFMAYTINNTAEFERIFELLTYAKNEDQAA